MEIIISRGLEIVLGAGYELKAQQVGLSTGRLDLLVARPDGRLVVVELKKGGLTSNHLDQVKGYSDQLSTDVGAKVEAMLIANSATSRMAKIAMDQGVAIKLISASELSQIATKIGLSDADLLTLPRRRKGVLFGGTGGAGKGLRTFVPLQSALNECPEAIRRLVQSVRADHKHAEFDAGTSQIALHYRGIKVGGLNRKDRGGHTYITSGVVLSPEHEEMLRTANFFQNSRNTTGKHDHIWWELSWRDEYDYRHLSHRALRYFIGVIDDAFNWRPR